MSAVQEAQKAGRCDRAACVGAAQLWLADTPSDAERHLLVCIGRHWPFNQVSCQRQKGGIVLLLSYLAACLPVSIAS